jgi:hypothetical protein
MLDFPKNPPPSPFVKGGSQSLNLMAVGYRLAEPLEHPIRVRGHAQELIHADETGVRVAGKLHWLHTATSDDYTDLFIHKQRGIEALKSEASVLKAFKGSVVHDCWSPYFHFDTVRTVRCTPVA